MYYAVLRKELVIPGYCGGTLTRRIGGVYELRKHNGMTQYRAVDTMESSPVPYGPWEEMTVEEARDVYFVRYFNDLSDAIEESFMVCEAAFC